MKKLLVMVVALAVVFGMSAGVMAVDYSWRNEGQPGGFDVKVNIIQAVNFALNDYTATLNIVEDEGIIWPDPVAWEITTNFPLKITFESQNGLGALESVVKYQIYAQDGVNETKYINFDGDNDAVFDNFSSDVRKVNGSFEVKNQTTSGIGWTDFDAGSYTDTVYITVEAQ